MKPLYARCLVVSCLLMLVGCAMNEPAPKGTPVSRAAMGDKWPLTVEDGYIVCGSPGITFVHGDTTYAINGTAMMHATERGWQDINSIWANDPKDPELKKGLGVFINMCP